MNVYVTDQNNHPLANICVSISTVSGFGSTDSQGNCLIDDSLCPVGTQVYAGQHQPGYNQGYVMEGATFEGENMIFRLPAVGSVPSNPGNSGNWL